MCVKVIEDSCRYAFGSVCGRRGSRADPGSTEAKGHAVALMMEEKYDDLADLRERAKAEVAKVVIGQDRTVELLLIAARRARARAPRRPAREREDAPRTRRRPHARRDVQAHPVHARHDARGAERRRTSIRAGEHLFLPGAVFTNVLLADEINRTPPRTQAALFEPMQERQVTIDGKTHKLPDPFLVIATQNPYEHEGVFALPEGQLDRFLFKIELDYADADSELAMLNLPHKGIAPDMLGEVRPLLGVVGLDKARQELEHTDVSETVGGTSSPRPPHAGAAGRRARRQLARDDPPVSRRRRTRASTAADSHGRGRSRDGAVRPAAPHRDRAGHERGQRPARRDGRRPRTDAAGRSCAGRAIGPSAEGSTPPDGGRSSETAPPGESMGASSTALDCAADELEPKGRN